MLQVSKDSIEVTTLLDLSDGDVIYKHNIPKLRTIYIHDIDSVSQVVTDSGFIRTDRCGIVVKEERLTVQEDYFKVRDIVFQEHNRIGY